MSFSTILSAVIEGLEVAFIHVEADISNGLAGIPYGGVFVIGSKRSGRKGENCN